LETAATWDCPADTDLANSVSDCATPWNGGAFVAAPTSTTLITRQTSGTVAFDVTADVAVFAAGGAYDGWLVGKTDETMSGRIDFTAREAGSGQPAQLTVEVQVPAPLPTVVLASPLDGTYSRNASVTVTGQIGGSAVGVTVDGLAAAVAPGGAFSAPLILSAGVNAIVAVATDGAGNQATAIVTVILDTTPPTLTVTSPQNGSISNQSQIVVTGTASDDNGVAALTVAGQPVTVTSGSFSTRVQLSAGANSIAVVATDLAGNSQSVAVTVTQYSVPAVSIQQPSDLSYVNATTVTVSGTASGATSVSVNGIAAVLANATFTASGVPLVEGGNTLTATATDGQGHVGTASINVVRDQTPPHVAIYTPSAGAALGATTVTVSGLVNDIVAGTVNTGNATVTVNGIPATVANRSFLAPNVPLQPGANVLTAVAVDAAGNQAVATVTVRQLTPAGPRVAAASGDGQSATVGAPLPQPLVAALVDASGQPVVGQQVLFQAIGNDGTFDNGRRTYAVLSDVAGHATVHFTLGSRAGAGNQLVRATVPGFAGPAQFVASAQPGSPALLVVDSGDQQQGVAGQALPLPLVAVVVDGGGNRLAGVVATSKVVKGGGSFANGQQSLSLTSDSDGRLITSFTTDAAEGIANNVVEATVDSLPGGPMVSFTASALSAFDPSQTAVSGVVLDNSQQPVPGATLRILGTALTTASDQNGLFQLTGVPAGSVQLIVDGSTVERPGSWPQLEFNLTPVPGRNNSLRMPVYLLPLDLASGITVDETHGGTIKLSPLPGFALTIQPGSVTFPGGGRSGTVSVTVVHSDKVPMVPNFGQQPRLIVTIQPAGAQFNPPATLAMPNVEGLPAGRVAEFYSFDHDLGHFVSIGPGTVSDDGTTITSNAGVGIVKAGWHCSGSPQSSGAPNACPECAPCIGASCTPKGLCSFCSTVGSACDQNGGCKTGKDLLPQICSRLTTTVYQGPSFTCKGCGTGVFRTYANVDPDCSHVSLSGTTLVETVVASPNTSGLPLCTAAPVLSTGLNCPINGTTPTNPETGGACDDHVDICGDPLAFPLGTCQATYQQVIKVDDCPVETHTFVFTITRSASSCSGEVQAQ
jgi:Glucodextranase, domain B/Carboxypeptidase regulatory-like domain